MAKRWAQGSKWESRIFWWTFRHHDQQRSRYIYPEKRKANGHIARPLGQLVRDAKRTKRIDLQHDRDSYHDPAYHAREMLNDNNLLWNASRGTKRYDPASRTYKEWYIPEDWYGNRIDNFDDPRYPRFSRDDALRIARRINRGERVHPESMPGWTTDGPSVGSLENYSQRC